MSRSYKHVPMHKDKTTCRYGKKRANRRIRHSQKCIAKAGGEEVALRGSVGKKMNESYDICDFQFGPSCYESWVEEAQGDKRELRKARSLFINK